MIFANESNRIRPTGVQGIDQTQIETFADSPGSVRIKNPTESIKGKYQCRYWFIHDFSNYAASGPNDGFIEKVVAGPQPPATPQPTLPPTYNDTAVINNFVISQPIIVGDDFSLNCTHSLSANQTLVSLTISKDNMVFYNYSDGKVHLQDANGINKLQLITPKNSTGNVIIKSAITRMNGDYKCELTINSTNGIRKSTNRTINVNVTNKLWSPVITRFDKPSVIVKDDDYWINCTYNPTTNEKLIALDLSKDGVSFYSYSEDKMHKNSNGPINVYKLITTKEIGSVKIESAVSSYQGLYKCTVTAQINGTIEGTASMESFIDFSEVKNIYLNNLEAPSKFGKGDDLLINCSLSLVSGVNITLFTISKDNSKFYTYKLSTGKIETNTIPDISDTHQIRTNIDEIGVVRIPSATVDLKGKYKCDANLLTPSGPLIESVEKYVDFTNEWKPDIYRFYVPDFIKRGSSYFWVNCSLSGLTAEEKSNYLLSISKDKEVFYDISSDSKANTYPVHGLENYQFDINGQYDGTVRIKDPTIEARGYYNCSLTTKRGLESKTVYKAYYVDFNKATALIISSSMYIVILFAIYLNL